MATITDTTPLWQILLFKATQSKTKRRNPALGMNRVRVWVVSLARLVLTLSGFGFLTWGMFTWDIVAGLITAGLSCFVLSWLTGSEESQLDNRPQGPPSPDQYLAERGYS